MPVGVMEDVMVGNFLKGTAFCAILGLSCVGVLTFVPDDAWEAFPSALAPVRANLAKYGVAPIKYREAAPNVEETEEVEANDGVRLRRRVKIGSSVSSSVYYEESVASSSKRPTDDLEPASLAPAKDPAIPQKKSSSIFSGTSTSSRVDDLRSEQDLALNSEPASDPNFDVYSRDDLDARGDDCSQDDRFPNDASVPSDSSAQVDDLVAIDSFPDEPQSESRAELDDFLTDRDALEQSFPASDDDYADMPPSGESDPTLEQSPYAEPVDAAPLTASTASNLSSAPASEPVSAPTSASADLPASSYAAPLNAQSVAANEPQGYLTPAATAPLSSDGVSNAGTVAAVAETSAAAVSAVTQTSSEQQQGRVQSFDEYLQSQSASRAQVQTSSSNVPAGAPSTASAGAPLNTAASTQAFIPETSAAIQSPASVPQSADLDSLLQSLAGPRNNEQTRALFIALNQRRVNNANAADRARVNEALDRLAYEVFYDPKKNILEPAYQVRPGDTLATIARQYGVTPELLGAINNLLVDANAPLQSGATLKTVRGPVQAQISVADKELLLTLNGLYAGRFRCGLPQTLTTVRGQYPVESKLPNPPCDAVDINGGKLTIPGGDANNPLGAYWIGLQGGPGLQGTNRPNLVGTIIAENGGVVFSNQEISQLNILLPIGALVTFVD